MATEAGLQPARSAEDVLADDGVEAEAEGGDREEDEPGVGLISDFLMRKSAQGTRSRLKGMLGQDAESMQKTAVQDTPGYMMAVEALDREWLVTQMMQDLTAYWKARKHPAWVTAGVGDKFRQQGKAITKFHQEAVCLHAEVARWYLREVVVHQRLQRHQAGVDKESSYQRHERLQDFWPQFHSRLKPPAPGAAGHDGSPRGGTRAPSPGPHGSPGRAAAATAAAAAAAAAGREPQQHRRERKGAPTWKGRAASSRVSAGKWDWTQGLSVDEAQGNSGQDAQHKQRTWGSTKQPAVSRLRAISQTANSLSSPSLEMTMMPGTLPSLAGGDSPMLKSRPQPASIFSEPSAGLLSPSRGRRWWSTQSPSALSAPPQEWPDSPESGGGGSAARQTATTLASSRSLPTLPGRRAATPTTLQEVLGRALLPDAPEAATASSPTSERQRGGRPRRGSLPLPRIVNANPVPWRAGGAPTRGSPDSPTNKYLQACSDNGVLPALMPFVTGHSLKLQAEGQVLGDSELSAIVGMMQGLGIQEVNLEGNSSISERGLVQLSEALLRGTNSSSMQKLSFKNCPRAGQCMCLCTAKQWCGCEPPGSCQLRCPMRAIVRLLSDDDGLQNLRRLDLSHVQVAAKHHLQLCQAIGQHRALDTVVLADIGLGKRGGGTSKAVLVRQCIIEIFNNSVLRHLNLSWNCLSSDIFALLGELIVSTKQLKVLEVANCSSSVATGETITPVVYLLEQLRGGSTLESLDVTCNRLDFRGGLVVEDSLDKCTALTDLAINQNPLGIVGLRCLFRLLCHSSCGIRRLRCEDSFTGLIDGAAVCPGGVQVFSRACPDRQWNLDLSWPYHRTLLRMLYKWCERIDLKPDSAFQNIVSSPPYSHASKGPDGVYQVPTSGKLSFFFSSEQGLADATKGVDDFDFAKVLECHAKMVQVRPDWLKVVPLLAHFKGIHGHAEEQRVVLDALAKDFAISYPQVRELCQDRAEAGGVVARLFACMQGGALTRCLAMQLVPSMVDGIRVLKKTWKLLNFNAENPTGRYRLDLGTPPEFAVAERLKLLDMWEAIVGRRKGRADTSEKGNYSRMRNVGYRHQPLDARSISEWTLPEFDVLELDYASARRPPLGAEVLEDGAFRKLATTTCSRSCSQTTRLKALRLVSDKFFLTSMQLRELLGLFVEGSARVELIVTFFGRIVDIYNSKVFRVRAEAPADFGLLQERLGFLEYFPFAQPEQASFSFNVRANDQRLAACLVRKLAEAEDPVNNLMGAKFTNEDGVVDPLPLGMPKNWGEGEGGQLPPAGTLDVGYRCAPESRSFRTRKELMEKYGGWQVTAEDGEVSWWSSLAAVPEDVLTFVEFLTAAAADPMKTFGQIDESSSGTISSQRFEEWFGTFDCGLFRDEQQKRLRDIYRYLDIHGDGKVTVKEWRVIAQIWQELKLSIKEFVRFAQNSLGRGSDWNRVWTCFDTNNNGSIEADEWAKAVQRVGYFGPPMPIFRCIDRDGAGKISREEFARLASSVAWAAGVGAASRS